MLWWWICSLIGDTHQLDECSKLGVTGLWSFTCSAVLDTLSGTLISMVIVTPSQPTDLGLVFVVVVVCLVTAH